MGWPHSWAVARVRWECMWGTSVPCSMDGFLPSAWLMQNFRSVVAASGAADFSQRTAGPAERAHMCRKATFCALFVAFALLFGCNASVPLSPKAIELNRMGALALAAGDVETAEVRFALAIEYHPRFTEAWVNLGLVEMGRGNLALAKKDFERARDLNEDLPAPHHALGLLFDRQGQASPCRAPLPRGSQG